jgi:2Fe-2S ferredoxin
MPTLVFIDQNGTSRTLNGDAGASAMEIAVQNGVAGIAAECGGACSCATCHVYVEQNLEVFSQPDETERELLEYTAADRMPHSRLGCQLKLEIGREGVVIRVPETQ